MSTQQNEQNEQNEQNASDSESETETEQYERLEDREVVEARMEALLKGVKLPVLKRPGPARPSRFVKFNTYPLPKKGT